MHGMSIARDLLGASTVLIPLELIACILYIFSSVRKEGFFLPIRAVYQKKFCLSMLHASWLWMCWSTNNQSQLTGERCHLLLLVTQSVVGRSRSSKAWFSWRYYCTWGTERLYIMIGEQAARRCSFCCVFINDYGSISCVATLPAWIPWAFLPLSYTHQSNLQRSQYQTLFFYSQWTIFFLRRLV